MSHVCLDQNRNQFWDTVRGRYKSVIFLENPHKRQPIGRPPPWFFFKYDFLLQHCIRELKIYNNVLKNIVLINIYGIWNIYYNYNNNNNNNRIWNMLAHPQSPTPPHPHHTHPPLPPPPPPPPHPHPPPPPPPGFIEIFHLTNFKSWIRPWDGVSVVMCRM